MKTSYVDVDDLTNGKKYYYKVSAVNSEGEGHKTDYISEVPIEKFPIKVFAISIVLAITISVIYIYVIYVMNRRKY